MCYGHLSTATYDIASREVLDETWNARHRDRRREVPVA